MVILPHLFSSARRLLTDLTTPIESSSVKLRARAEFGVRSAIESDVHDLVCSGSVPQVEDDVDSPILGRPGYDYARATSREIREPKASC